MGDSPLVFAYITVLGWPRCLLWQAEAGACHGTGATAVCHRYLCGWGRAGQGKRPPCLSEVSVLGCSLYSLEKSTVFFLENLLFFLWIFIHFEFPQFDLSLFFSALFFLLFLFPPSLGLMQRLTF